METSKVESVVRIQAKAKINQLEQELRSLLEKVQRRKQPAGALARAVISSDDLRAATMTSALLFERNQKSAEAQELVSAVMTSAYLLEEAGIIKADVSISVEKRRGIRSLLKLLSTDTVRRVTVDEAVVSYYSRSCRQLPSILLLTNLLAVAIHITVDESLMSNVEQEADNNKRNSEESDVVLKNQQMATVEWIQQKRKDKDSAYGFALRISRTSFDLPSRWEVQLQAYRYHQLDNQTQATAHQVVSYNEPVVAMHPVAKIQTQR
ncbi:pentatricopeptide repeat-containing protein mitochondrial [Dorcoceras hygrometricum]|uniref:Pentatricopeptide repeat-containing protein mitochondrial n=1 Tax=Dorcoceras hygrometricum TaxID=472368 RepID=A0A2Z7CK29_9LAMI|nr:pentatricopeptide repeat-containing protein mitochondrial [Dorcoceras hygrometricum]